MDKSTHPVLLFDGVCHFCDSAVQFVLKMDKKEEFLFAPLQSEHGQQLLKEAGLPPDYCDSLVLAENGRYYAKSDGVLRIAKRLPGMWKLLYAYKIIPRPLRDAVYDIVAQNRYKWFGKKESCRIPLPHERKRFLN